MSKAFGIIMAASNRYKVEGLQEHRPAASFSFGGRFRVVDFPLSNMSNSGIDRILIYINGNPRSLVEHLGTGRHYNINPKRGKLQPLFHEEGNTNPIYNTNAASFFNSIDIIERIRQDYVVIAPSNMIYAQDYDKLLDQHIESGADITMLYHRVDDADIHYLGCNTLSLNRQKGVKSLEENMGNAKDKNIFMDTYVMSKDLFVKLVKEGHKISSIYHFSKIVSLKFDELDVRGVAHKGYFATATDFKSYYDANMRLLDPKQAASLFDPKWPILTKTTDSCPTQYFEGGSAKSSLISNACTIKGTIENSVLGRGVRVGKGAVIKNCVILSYATIADGAVLENQVVDKWAQIIHVKEIKSSPDAPGYIERDDVL